MSTHIEYVVDVEATADEAAELGRRVVELLVQRGVILPTAREHAYLSGGPRYAAGPNVGLVATHNECFFCGLDVLVGRNVCDPGEFGLNSISCPRCGISCDLNSDDWAVAIGEWSKNVRPGMLVCAKCQHSASVVLWKFEPAWGFGELAFQFGEWLLEKEFVDEISLLLGHRVVWVKSHG